MPMSSFSITQHKINSVAINPSGDWLAFGSSTLGQLLVWEWRSESYIMKQQGHFYDMNVVAYSPDGQYIATGGDDGKVSNLVLVKSCWCLIPETVQYFFSFLDPEITQCGL